MKSKILEHWLDRLLRPRSTAIVEHPKRRVAWVLLHFDN